MNTDERRAAKRYKKPFGIIVALDCQPEKAGPAKNKSYDLAAFKRSSLRRNSSPHCGAISQNRGLS